jgi:hypothetical protein
VVFACDLHVKRVHQAAYHVFSLCDGCLQYAAFEDEQGIYLVLEFAERVCCAAVT